MRTGAQIAQVGEKSRPNVLFIISGDLRPRLGCYRDTVVKTPSLDRFTEQALRFYRAYVQRAVCSLLSYSMLSGLRSNTKGLRGFGTWVRDVVPDVITLRQHFKQNGYHSRGFGKIFHIYDESMLGDENDPESWNVPLEWPKVPVWGPEHSDTEFSLHRVAGGGGNIVARELYDHRKDRETGFLEKVNLGDLKAYVETVAKLSKLLHQMVPHTK